MRGMTQKTFATSIFGDAEATGASRSRLLERLRRSDFSGRRKNPELLSLNAADRASSRPLTTIQDEETITIHSPGRSTYPEEKSVLTSGTTPVVVGHKLLTCSAQHSRVINCTGSCAISAKPD